jgi:ABC-type lipoprotein release transport system permease subunit
MSTFFSRLAADLRFNRWRLMLLIGITVAALFTYVALGAILAEMQTTLAVVWRTETPYDVAVAGPRVDPAKLADLDGIIRQEAGLQTSVYLGGSETSAIALSPGQGMFALTLASGRLPTVADEVTVPGSVAETLRVTVGDRLSILPKGGGTALALTVSGILEAKIGNPPTPLLTFEGIRRCGPPNELLLLTFDAGQDLKAVGATLRGLYPTAEVQVNEEQYQGTQQGVGIAGTLISTTRNLVLLITAAAVGSLVWLVQRQRSFEFGLLRSLGVPKVLVVLPACLNVTLAFAASAPLAWWLLKVARPLLRAPRLDLLRSVWLSSTVTFAAIGLAIIAGVSATLVSRRIPALLNDTWGRG